ncbi:MAG: hypothetical protein KF770_01545 [Anaerolineae bacterium]|nr:hypothetical protein [Anaerolineae bacterium]
MITQTKEPTRYHIIESDLGPLISESRMTVYDVLEAQNSGQTLYEISMNRNLSPMQVQVAFEYIEQHRERLQAELEEILKVAAERKRYYDAIAEEMRQKIAQLPMTPEREAFYALREKHLQAIKARESAADSQ